MKAVFQADGLTSTQKAVLLALAEHAGSDGDEAFPSVERMTIYTGLKERTVRKALKELREKKLIKPTKSAAQHRPTTYQIKIKKLLTMRHPRLRHTTPRPAPDAPLDNPDLHQVPSRPAPDAPKPPLTIKKEGDDEFSQVVLWLETEIGTPLKPSEEEIKAINEMIKLGVIETDIKNAVAFFKGNGRVARGAAHLLNSVEFQIRKRKQSTAERVPVPIREEKYVEVWE